MPEIGLKVILAAAEAGDGDETGDGEARLGDGDEVGDGEARLGDGDASAMASGDVMAQAPESSAIATPSRLRLLNQTPISITRAGRSQLLGVQAVRRCF